MQLLVCREDLHVAKEGLERLRVDESLTHRDRLECSLQIHQLLSSEHLLNGNVLYSEIGAVLLSLLHGFLQDSGGVGQTEFRYAGQLVGVLKVGLLRTLICILIVDLGVDTSLGLVFNPLANEELVLGVVEVTSLTLALVADPVTFEMVAISFGEYTITVAFSLMPLAFVDIFIRVDHATLTLRQAVHPIPVVSIAVFVEESASAVLLVLVPVACVLSPELVALVLPVGALAVTLVNSPHAFVLVFVLVKLDAEALLAVVAPVANVLLTRLPNLSLNRSVLRLVLLLDPVDRPVGSVFLGLGVVTKK